MRGNKARQAEKKRGRLLQADLEEGSSQPGRHTDDDLQEGPSQPGRHTDDDLEEGSSQPGRHTDDDLQPWLSQLGPYGQQPEWRGPDQLQGLGPTADDVATLEGRPEAGLIADDVAALVQMAADAGLTADDVATLQGAPELTADDVATLLGAPELTAEQRAALVRAAADAGLTADEVATLEGPSRTEHGPIDWQQHSDGVMANLHDPESWNRMLAVHNWNLLEDPDQRGNRTQSGPQAQVASGSNTASPAERREAALETRVAQANKRAAESEKRKRDERDYGL
jgi:hypothetical protein